MSIRSDKLLNEIEQQLALGDWGKFRQLWEELVPGGAPLSFEEVSDTDTVPDKMCVRFTGKSVSDWKLLLDKCLENLDEPVFEQNSPLERRLARLSISEVTVSVAHRTGDLSPRIKIVVSQEAGEPKAIGFYLDIADLDFSPFRDKFLDIYKKVLSIGSTMYLDVAFPWYFRFGFRAYCALEESYSYDTDDPDWASDLSPVMRFFFLQKQRICGEIELEAAYRNDAALDDLLRFVLSMALPIKKETAFVVAQAASPISATTLFAHFWSSEGSIPLSEYSRIKLSPEVIRASRRIRGGYRHVDLMTAQCIAIAELINGIKISDVKTWKRFQQSETDFDRGRNIFPVDDWVQYVSEELRYQGYMWLDEESFFGALLKPFDSSVKALDYHFDRLKVSKMARHHQIEDERIKDCPCFVMIAPYFSIATGLIMDYGSEPQKASLLSILRSLEERSKHNYLTAQSLSRVFVPLQRRMEASLGATPQLLQ